MPKTNRSKRISVSEFAHLIVLVRTWSSPIMWEATWSLAESRKRCLDRNIPDLSGGDDPEFRLRSASEYARKWDDRMRELDEINRLIEKHFPEMLGKVPERPLEPPFDYPTALLLAQQMKEVWGLLLGQATKPVIEAFLQEWGGGNSNDPERRNVARPGPGRPKENTDEHAEVIRGLRDRRLQSTWNQIVDIMNEVHPRDKGPWTYEAVRKIYQSTSKK